MIILGKSESTITMILDNLESQDNFPTIGVVNNLHLKDQKQFINNKFKIYQETKLPHDIDGKEFALGTYKPDVKQKIFKLFGIPLNHFPNIIHKSSQISSTVKLGNGLLVNSIVSIAAHTEIGNFVTINRNASVGHHTLIGDFSTINPGAVVCGNVNIGTGTIIGAGAIVIDGITIGNNCVIGAGSVVVKDVPNETIGFGNPFKKR